MTTLDSKKEPGEERHSRILAAALEVFSRSPFEEATTEEIARRAHVSKRDIYALFPGKHAILMAVVDAIMQSGDANLKRVIADSEQTPLPVEQLLEIIGLALISEILSPLEGFVYRLVFSESVGHPQIGSAFFNNWYARRSQMVIDLLSRQKAMKHGRRRRVDDTAQAAKHFLALTIYQPQFSASLGLLDMWNPKAVRTHVKSAVDCFLKAYPAFVGT